MLKFTLMQGLEIDATLWGKSSGVRALGRSLLPLPESAFYMFP